VRSEHFGFVLGSEGAFLFILVYPHYQTYRNRHILVGYFLTDSMYVCSLRVSAPDTLLPDWLRGTLNVSELFATSETIQHPRPIMAAVRHALEPKVRF
jgi:hypothetical protein